MGSSVALLSIYYNFYVAYIFTLIRIYLYYFTELPLTSEGVRILDETLTFLQFMHHLFWPNRVGK